MLDHARLALSGCHPVVLGGSPDPAVGDEICGMSVARDHRRDRLGPLAGIEAGLAWLEQVGASRGESAPAWCVCIPADTPFLPVGLVGRLAASIGSHSASTPIVASHRDRLHPTVAAWPISIRPALTTALEADGSRSIRRFLEQAGYVICVFDEDGSGPDGDPFFNVNTPTDLAKAEAFLTARPAR